MTLDPHMQSLANLLCGVAARELLRELKDSHKTMRQTTMRTSKGSKGAPEVDDDFITSPTDFIVRD